MADQLLECAKRYRELLDWDYEFIAGRKGNVLFFTVDFIEDDFHHLVGLHKLKDNDFVRTTKRSKIFNSILSGKLTEEKIQKSWYYHHVKNRMQAFLESINVIEEEPEVFRYSINRASGFSKIDADYLLYHTGDRNIYIFLKRRQTSSSFACISLFFEEQTDYTAGQARYTLLKLSKRNRLTGNAELIYQHPKFEGDAQI